MIISGPAETVNSFVKSLVIIFTLAPVKAE